MRLNTTIVVNVVGAILGMLPVASWADASASTLAELKQEEQEIAASGEALLAEKRELDAAGTDLQAVSRKIESAQAALGEEITAFGSLKAQVEADVDAWNDGCAGERPEPVYNSCLDSRGPLAARKSEAEAQQERLRARAAVVDGATTQYNADLAELQGHVENWHARAQVVLQAQKDHDDRVRQWKASSLKLPACRCAGLEPEATAYCFSQCFDNASPRLRSCLDIEDLDAFHACLRSK
jgi:hypothetical protein